MKNPFKGPRVNKTKEQLLQEQKLKAEANRHREIITNHLYPILYEHTTSIAHAQQTCQVMKVVILQAMQKPFREKNVGDLGLEEELTKEKDQKDKALFESMVNHFKDVSIADALKILDGMGGAIDGWVRQDASKKEFKSIELKDLIN